MMARDVHDAGRVIRKLDGDLETTKMAIEINCECGKGYRVSDDKAGQQFKCRDCGTLVRAPEANANDSEGNDTTTEFSEEYVPSHRDTRPGRNSAKKKTRSKSGRSRAVKRRLATIGGTIALIGGGLMIANQLLPPPQMLLLKMVTFGVVFFLILPDQGSRWRIRSDVENFGGTVQSISWRPLEGLPFTRGFGLGLRVPERFYEVQYTDRDGQSKCILLGSDRFGTNWDD